MRFGVIGTSLTVFLLGGLALAAPSSCLESLGAFLRAESTPVVTVDSQLETIASRQSALEKDLSNAAAKGELTSENAAALVQKLEKSDESWIKSAASHLCLGKKTGSSDAILKMASAARGNVVKGLMLSATSLAGTQAMQPDREFPFALLGDSLVMIPLMAEVSCRSRLKMLGAEENGAFAPVTFREKAHAWLAAYRTYATWVAPGAVVYLGFVFADDKAHGRKVDWNRYAETAAASMIWDLGMGTINVSFLDPLYLKKMPQFKTWLAKIFDNKVLVGRLKPLSEAQIKGLKTSDMPGWVVEMATRISIGSVRSHFYLELQDAIVDAGFVKKFFEQTGIAVLPKAALPTVATADASKNP